MTPHGSDVHEGELGAPTPGTTPPSVGTDGTVGPQDAPPAPDGVGVLEAERAANDAWGHVTRAGATVALIGVAVVAWAQFTFESRWVTRFVVQNDLEMPARLTLIASFLVGAIVAVLLGAVAMLVARRRGVTVATGERFTRFLLPLAFLPTVPLLFRYKPWDERLSTLLATCAVVVVMLEAATRVALHSVPERLVRATSWLASRRPLVLARLPLVLVAVSALGFAAFFAHHGIAWHRALQTHGSQLGFLSSLLFGALRGEFFLATFLHGPEGPSHLASHFELGVHGLLPFYAVVPRAETLIVAQAVLVGAGALPLFAFARERGLSAWASAAVALAYLANPSLHAATFYEASSLAMSIPLVLWAAWAVQGRSAWVACLVVALAASMREDVALVLGGFSLAAALAGHRAPLTSALAACCLGYFVVVRFAFMPALGDPALGEAYRDLWAPGEKGIGSVVRTLVTNPLYVLVRQLEVERVTYLLHVLLPVAFLPLRRASLWLAFVPALALTVFGAANDAGRSATFPSAAHWVPYLFVAAVVVLADSAGNAKEGAVRRRAGLLALMFATAVLSFNLGAFGRRSTFVSGLAAVEFQRPPGDAERYADLLDLVAEIPTEASVAATETLAPHVSSRLHLYALERGAQGADYLLASRGDVARTKPHLAAALGEGGYGVVARRADFALLRRHHRGPLDATIAREWGLE